MGPRRTPGRSRPREHLPLGRGSHARTRRRRVSGAKPHALVRSHPARLAQRHEGLCAAGPDRRSDARRVRRSGGEVESPRLRRRGSGAGRLRLAGVRDEQRYRHDGDSQAASRRHAQRCAEHLRHHRPDRLLRPARHRRAEAGRRGAGLRRRRRHRIGRGPDRQDQGLRPRRRHRRRREEMCLAHR